MASIMFAMATHVITTTLYHRAAWRQTEATVVKAEPAMLDRGKGRVTAELDLAVRYRIDGTARTWTGLGKDIGVYKASPGDVVALYYDPADPGALDAAEMKGWRGGLLVLGISGGFVAFYLWFFWFRKRPPTRPTFTANRSQRPIRT